MKTDLVAKPILEGGMREDTGPQSLTFKAKAEWERGQSHTSQQAQDAKPRQGQGKNQAPGAT